MQRLITVPDTLLGQTQRKTNKLVSPVVRVDPAPATSLKLRQGLEAHSDQERKDLLQYLVLGMVSG